MISKQCLPFLYDLSRHVNEVLAPLVGTPTVATLLVVNIDPQPLDAP